MACARPVARGSHSAHLQRGGAAHEGDDTGTQHVLRMCDMELDVGGGRDDVEEPAQFFGAGFAAGRRGGRGAASRRRR